MSEQPVKTKLRAYLSDHGVGTSEEITYQSGTVLSNIDIVLDALGDISGIVKNTEGKPVPSAKVEYHAYTRENRKNMITDESGNYHFDQISLQETFLSAEADGYPYQVESLKYPPEQKKVQLDIILGKENNNSSIEGIVLDQNNQPLSKVTITAVSSGAREWWDFLEFQYETESDDTGQFKITGLDKDKPYFIRAKMNQAPFMTRDYYDILANSQFITIKLISEPVELIVRLAVPNDFPQTSKEEPFTLKVIPDTYNNPGYIMKIGQESPVILMSQYGRYQVSVEGEGYAGQQTITIDSQTPKQYTIQIPLEKQTASFKVTGRCLHPGLKPLTYPVRVRMQMLDNNNFQYTQEALVIAKSNCTYSFSISKAGTYELIFLRDNSKVLQRMIVNLAPENADPNTRIIQFPDVVVP